jgi:hypothetical protein
VTLTSICQLRLRHQKHPRKRSARRLLRQPPQRPVGKRLRRRTRRVRSRPRLPHHDERPRSESHLRHQSQSKAKLASDAAKRRSNATKQNPLAINAAEAFGPASMRFLGQRSARRTAASIAKQENASVLRNDHHALIACDSTMTANTLMTLEARPTRNQDTRKQYHAHHYYDTGRPRAAKVLSSPA